MKILFFALAVIVSFTFASCDSIESVKYNIRDLNELGKTCLTVDGSTIPFDTYTETLDGKEELTKDMIYRTISSKASMELYDKDYYERKLECDEKGLSQNIISYSKIAISYKDRNKTVVLKYEHYESGELLSASTLCIPYNKALKMFS